MKRIFIGYDPRQPISLTVLASSIMRRSSVPVSITPLVIETLPMKRTGLTPFTYSRFMVPFLCDYTGEALFLDADILVMADIAELFALLDPKCEVMVSRNKLEFEWASVMLFNCARCTKLTPEYIETAKGLHNIEWANKIGDLPREWNHLVGYDPDPEIEPKLIHYTQGVPLWPETADGGFREPWVEEAQIAMSAEPWANIMGRSVHAQPVVERLQRQGNDAALRNLRAA